jgi:Flp pilus assembly protein CpaB
MTGLRAAVRDLVRAAARRRWLLAGGLAAAAVATGLPVLAPAPAAATGVLSAARDLPAGSSLTATDVTRVDLPTGAVPDGALPPGEAVAGRLLAGAVRRGEPLTDVRLVGPGLLASLGDGGGPLVAVPVRLADPAAASLLRAGDRVDVLAAATSPDAPPSAAVVAAAAPVLAVPPVQADLEGALVVLATSTATASRLAAAAVSSRLSVVVRP